MGGSFPEFQVTIALQLLMGLHTKNTLLTEIQ